MARQHHFEQEVPLAGLTTLGVGGAARYFARCHDESELSSALAQGHAMHLPLLVLGGGSNLLVADAGYDGLCIRMESNAVEFEAEGRAVVVRADAGVCWDALVERAVAEGLGGLECLSGIPGCVGAAPLQNIGAYGQEVSEVLRAVEVVERNSGARRRIAAAECGFGYRWSRFKGQWRDRFVILRVEFLLERRATGAMRYGDLRRHFDVEEGGPEPLLAAVREAVLEVRRAKSMVIDPADPNRRSAGSFFVNQVVTRQEAEAIRGRWQSRGGEGPMPTFPAAGGGVKLSAAWLIERAGFPRGYQLGPAGISTRHTLALINRGGATAADLLRLAGRVRAGVAEAFAVTLRPEPVFAGFSRSVEELLAPAGG